MLETKSVQKYLAQSNILDVNHPRESISLFSGNTL